MKIAICDDCPSDLRIMEDYVKQYHHTYDYYLFASGQALLNACNQTVFDIIFLDIEMDAPTGYEVGKYLHEQGVHSLIIFTTNTLDYAVRGYGIAFRYLPKPVSVQMFTNVMKLCEEHFLPRSIELMSNHQKVMLDTNHLVYFEALSHFVAFHLDNGQIVKAPGNLSEYKDKLMTDSFVQIHKSYCINLNYLSSTRKNTVILDNNIELSIGRSKKEEFFQRLQAFMRSN